MLSSFTLDFEKHPKLQFRIDSFSVPTATRADFEAAMRRNLDFIRTLPGFLGHLVFEKTGGPSNFNIVTIAVWESPEAIEKATVAVRHYYTQIGFDPAEATARWGVKAEIGQYSMLEEAR
jgi:heme-degrading monooxygenase HmoA